MRILTFIFLLMVCSAQAATLYLDVTTGDDADSGLTEALAKQTFAGINAILAQGDKVWVKASADYVVQEGATGAIFNVSVAGGSATGQQIEFEGYTTTIGDGGKVTLDADVNSLTSCIIGGSNSYYAIKNFICIGASSYGVNAQSASVWVMDNCEFHNNGGIGVRVGSNGALTRCISSGNSAAGMQGTTYCRFIDCVSYSNTGNGIISGVNSFFSNIVAYDNTGAQLNLGARIGTALNCTVDGNDTTDGIDADNSPATIIRNCILYNCDDGIFADAGTWQQQFSFSNVFFANGTNRDNWTTDSTDLDLDPRFIDPDNNDYRLGPGSPAVGFGYNVAELTDYGVSHISVGAYAPAAIPWILADGGDSITIRATVLVSAGQSADSVYLDLDPNADFSAAGDTSSAAAVGATTTLTATITLTGTDSNHLVPWRLRVTEDDGTVTLQSVNYTVTSP